MLTLVYPAIVLAAGMGTLLLCMVFVIPRFSPIFADLGARLPLSTRILLEISEFTAAHGWTIALIALAAVAVIKRMISNRSITIH